jgi:hypothetical protein
MNGARLGIAAQALGIGEAAWRKALEFAHEREQFGRPIIQFPAVYDLLIRSRLDLEAARELTYDTARVVDLDKQLDRLLDAGLVPEDQQDQAKSDQRNAAKYAATLTPMSKYWATEMSNRVAYNAIAVYGGSGYMKDYDVERHYRDARITSIYEGTTQLQIVAAIGGILSGNFRPRLIEKAEQQFEEKKLQAPAKRLRKHIEKCDAAVEYVKSKKNPEYSDYVARHVVDLWMETYVGFLMLEGADRDPDRVLLATKYVKDVIPRLQYCYRMIRSGDTTAVRKWDKLLTV